MVHQVGGGPVKRVFVYCRVSTSVQVSGDGFPRQEEACRAFAGKQGWSVLRVFKEQQTGSDEWADRKYLSEAMELSSGVHEVDTIIVERADRLSRDLIVSELFLRECKKKNVKIYAADSGEELVNSSGDPTRTLIRQILGAVAEWDKTVLCQKLQAGRRAMVKKTGKPCGGKVANPYGDRGGVAQKNEERGILRTILTLRGQGLSYENIATRLRNCRIKTPNPLGSPNVPWQWSGKTVERLHKLWTGRILPTLPTVPTE